MASDSWQGSYDHWKTTDPGEEFLGPDPDDGQPNDPPCPTCSGSGVIHPLYCPPGFFVASYDECPHCDGTGVVL